MNNKILLICMIMLAVPLLSSQIYQQGKDVDLKIPFEVNGSQADSNSICNISIQYPNSTYLANNLNMSNINNGEFNVTITSSNTTELGEHDWTMFCCDEGRCAAGKGSFIITASGSELSTGEALVYIIFLIAILFVFSLCSFWAIRIPFKNVSNDDGVVISINDLKYVKILLIVLCYLLLMFIFGVTKSITENYLFLNGASQVFNWLYLTMFYITWPIMVSSLVFTVILYLNSKKLKEQLMRGIPLRSNRR